MEVGQVLQLRHLRINGRRCRGRWSGWSGWSGLSRHLLLHRGVLRLEIGEFLVLGLLVGRCLGRLGAGMMGYPGNSSYPKEAYAPASSSHGPVPFRFVSVG